MTPNRSSSPYFLSSTVLCTLLLFNFTVQSSMAQESGTSSWTQWRGPGRDGTVSALTIKSWPTRLVMRWQKEVGLGYSGPLVKDGRVWVHARQGDEEIVECLTLEGGRRQWTQRYEAPFEQDPAGRSHGRGPYSTPCLSDGRLFTLSVTTVLTAWEAKSGAMLWRRDYSSEFDWDFPYFGASASPLVWNQTCFVHFGGYNREKPEMPGQGAMIALDVRNGREIWRWKGDDPALAASPLIHEFNGVPQLVFKTRKKIVGVEPTTGKELWQIPFEVYLDNTIITPVLRKNLLLTSDYQKGTYAWRIERIQEEWKPESLWKNTRVSMFTSSPVLAGDILTCFSHYRSGHVVGVDINSGEILWQGPPRWGEHASLIAAGDKVLVFLGDGRLVVGEVSHEGFQTVQDTQLVGNGSWAHPALVEDSILIKNGPLLVMFQVPSD